MSSAEKLKADLESFVSREAGSPARVVRAVPLAGGASMESWAIDLELGGETLALVLRRDMATNMFAGALSRAQEFRLLALAHQRGVLAPRPRWLCDGPSRAYFLMDRLPGESVGRRVVKLPELASARTKLAAQLGEQLARIHAITPDEAGSDLPRPRDGETSAQMSLRLIRDAMDSVQRDNAAWEFAWRWLVQREARPSGVMTLLHGDFRVGNVLVTPDGLTGVLDWEFAHVGDPLDDLAWPLVRDWRFENDALPVGGVGAVDDYLAAYRAHGGRAVDRNALHWWETLGNLRWAVFCHSQAERHLRGQDRSVELASLGRKSAEIEWELLELIRAAEAR